MKHSILNDVLGPVMRGPSSSHTAASYRIAAIARSLLKSSLKEVIFTFDREGSYGEVFRQQGSDLAFAAGALGWDITDSRFEDVLGIAQRKGKLILFQIDDISDSNHPNEVLVSMAGTGGDSVELLARSVGGGAIVITKIDGWPVWITGDSHDLFIVTNSEGKDSLLLKIEEHNRNERSVTIHERDGQFLIHIAYLRRPVKEILKNLESMTGVLSLKISCPVVYACPGEPLFTSAKELLKIVGEKGKSLADASLSYESQMLKLPEEEIWAEMSSRLEIMEEAARAGIEDHPFEMKLIRPSAGKIYKAEIEGKLPIGGLHSQAMARALGVMHVNASKGIICAAPTAGSSGVIPGVILTLAERFRLSREEKIRALFTASAIGLIVAMRATFSAEEAGCQAEIGVAGAMASAAVVEVAGGSPEQALDAASVFLQNSLGSICDPVQGFVEIPCHTRNGVAASSALVCADIVMGGYFNPLPFDEVVDAMYSVGKLLPRELRCTAKGGLSICPSGCALPLLSK